MKIEDAEKGIALAKKSLHYSECAGKIKGARPVSINYHNIAGETLGSGFNVTFDFNEEQINMLKDMLEFAATKFKQEANDLGIEF